MKQHHRGNTWYWLLGCVIAIYPLCWIGQGLDFTDTGFAMTNYNLIFNHPHSIYYWAFNYWLTDVIGGLWLALFGHLGLFGVRLAAALLILMTNALVYRLYRGWVPTGTLLIAILFGETFIERMYWLNYDNLSAFMFVLAGYFMVRGIVNHRLTLIFLSGLVMGLNIFTRITNAAGLVIILAIFISAYAAGARMKRQLTQAATFVLGIISAVGLVVIAMAMMGQLKDFVDNLSTLFFIAGGNQNTHSSGKLLKGFVHDEGVAIRTLLYGLAFSACLTIGNTVLLWRKLRTLRPVFTSLCVLVAAVSSFAFMMNRYFIVAGLTGVLYGLLLFCGVTGLYKKDVLMSTSSFVSLLVLFAAPLGSDLGIRLAVYGMYLALPIGLHVLWNTLPRIRSIVHFGWTSAVMRTGVALVLCGLFTDGIVTGYKYTYRDTTHRLLMTSPLVAQKLRAVYTTEERSNVVNPLFQSLQQFVHPGDVLLAYEETSLVYYVTDTVPYMNTSWPMLYSPEQFTIALQTALRTHTALPVVVRAKGATADFNWPNVKELRTSYPHIEDRALMEAFLAQHHYRVAWENSFFQIIVPPSFKGR